MSQNEFAPWNDPAANPLIQFKNVTKKFGDFTAVDDLSIDIYEQEFFALLGPSGCGKTTMMRMLAGFEKPTSGTILLDGKDISPIPPNKRSVNMMFQSYALFPHLTVYDNIAFGLKRSNMPKDEIDGRVKDMLRLVQIEKFAQRKPEQISGGQRQRVALARALAKAPKLLLLDEPLSALDKKLRQDTQFELMDIQEKTGTTFVIVTHDQEEAMTVASRVAVMNFGKLVQVDTPTQIYEAPNSAYVADFIGDVNIIEGHATGANAALNVGANESISISWADGQPPITATASQPMQAGKVNFVIRPEKIAISSDKPADRRNAVQGKVLDIAYLGNMSTYHVEMPNGVIIKATAANQRRRDSLPFTWEDPVWLSWSDTAGVVLEGSGLV